MSTTTPNNRAAGTTASRQPSSRHEGSVAVEDVRLAGWLQDLLAAFKEGLERLYGERLEDLYLFGSHARGEAQLDSDVDLLVVLDEVASYGREIRYTSELTASLALEYEVSISCVFMSSANWKRAEGPFLVNVHSDAIAA